MATSSLNYENIIVIILKFVNNFCKKIHKNKQYFLYLLLKYEFIVVILYLPINEIEQGDLVMLYGIKYKSNSQGLKIMNYCMQKYGGGIWIKGKCDLYFTNPLEAYLMSRKLTKVHENLKYCVFIPSAEERANIPRLPMPSWRPSVRPAATSATGGLKDAPCTLR